MAQAYDAIIATITVASDATSVTKAMVKSTQWRAGTSGTWLSTDCTLTAGNTYQFRTPLSGMDSGSTAVLPNIKASVTVVWDTSATAISSVGDYFMYYYALGCTSLTSLSVPDTSGLTSVGNSFMYNCARGCTNLTSLSVPDTSGLTSVGTSFMYAYAFGCSSLTSLSAPDTSGLTSVGISFMSSYAYNCSSLTSLSVPDTSGLKSVGDYFMSSYANGCSSLTSLSVPDTSRLASVGYDFMGYYAEGCTSLTSLSVPDTSGLTSVRDFFMSGYAHDCSSLTSLTLINDTGWFSSHDISWDIPSTRLNYLYAYCEPSYLTNWRGLTASGKTLYTNYIRSTNYVKTFSVNSNSSRGLFTIGNLLANSSRTLYLSVVSTGNSQKNLYINGTQAGSSTRKLYLIAPISEYSRENANELKANDTNLGISFTQQEYLDAEEDDNIYVDLNGTAQYSSFLFKQYNTNESNLQKFSITWKGKSSIAPSSSPVYLQVYNRTTSSWETLDSDNTSLANTKFTLIGAQLANLSNYYDSDYIISIRVYQEII